MTAICVYDLTIAKQIIEIDPLCNFFNSIAKKWVFQLEQGKDGYQHYQCRLSLQTKKRISTFIYEINSSIINGAHVSATMSQNMGNFFYVTKEETRLQGPWNNIDYNNLKRMPKKYQGEIQWLPWQKSTIDRLSDKPNDRHIDLYIDKKGNIGKSFLVNYRDRMGLSHVLPPYNDLKDIMRWAYSLAIQDEEKNKFINSWLIDLPKSMSKNHLCGLFSALESLKNGKVYEDRYKAQSTFLPDDIHIIVFTNVLPDKNMLSLDRWKLWTIEDNQLLQINWDHFPNEKEYEPNKGRWSADIQFKK